MASRRLPKTSSVEKRLAQRGYGHRLPIGTMHIGEHEIYRLSDGLIVGSAFADEAMGLIER